MIIVIKLVLLNLFLFLIGFILGRCSKKLPSTEEFRELQKYKINRALDKALREKTMEKLFK